LPSTRAARAVARPAVPGLAATTAILAAGRLLSAVVRAQRWELLAGGYVQADETTMPCQTGERTGRHHRAYLWEFSRPGGIVAAGASRRPDRSGRMPCEISRADDGIGMPESVSFREGALVDTAGVVLHGLELSGIRAGGTVAVIDVATRKILKKISFAVQGLRKETIQAVGISITQDGKTAVNHRNPGDIVFNVANRSHSEEVVKGAQSGIMLELK